MFGAWKFSRVRSAALALEQGRLDEAYQRLGQIDARDLRGAERFVAELVQGLLARARVASQEGRYGAAMDDLNRIDALGPAPADAGALRQRIETQVREQIDRKFGHEDARRDAEARLRDGRLESGRLAVDRVPDAGARQQLRRDLDLRVRRSQDLLSQSDAALRAGDVMLALRFWTESVEQHGRTREADDVAGRLGAAAESHVGRCLAEGRLDRILLLWDAAARLREHAPSLRGLSSLVELLRHAGGRLDALATQELQEALLRIPVAGGVQAAWVREALDALGAIRAAHDRLISGPLGLLTGGSAEPAAAARPGVAGPAPRGEGAVLDGNTLLLLVDGAGSALILAHDVVRIGRAGGSLRTEVQIPADIQSHHADVVRSGEDYFVVAHGPVQVNHKPVTRSLLRDGDRIHLGDHARLVFHKPSSKSDTAVLRLGSRSRLAQDVSSVVLFRESCLIGPGSHCHLQTRDGADRIVVFEQAGRLMVRHTQPEGGVHGALPLALRETRQVGELRLTVTDYSAGVA